MIRTSVGKELERLLRDGVQSARWDARLLDRYLDDRDESAFEALVERHGPMVLSLCRRYLRDPRDVEDAFQATFLVLVRKGASLRDKSSLSSWLYGVAYRVALRSRANLLKRRTREGEPAGLTEAVAPAARLADDSLAVLDAELSRLPEKLRAPLVLYYLEGRTHDQAAFELGWPVGTVRSRMAKGREVLAGRLTRRGLDASAFLALLRPDYLITSTILPTISSASTSWPATALAQGVLAAMFISQLKWICVATTAVGLLTATAGVGALAVQAPGGAEGAAPAVSEPKSSEAPQADKPSPRPDQPIDIGVRTPNDDVQTRLAEMERKIDRTPNDVQSRLAEMERKIDRLTELLERMEERSARPPEIVPPRKPVYLRKPNLSDDVRPRAPSASPSPAALPATRPVPDRLPALRDSAPSLPGPLPYIENSPRVLLPSAAPGGEPPLETPPVRTSSRVDASPTTPLINPRRPASATDDLISDLDGGGVRVIQAQLLNLYRDYKRKQALHAAGAIAEEVYLVPLDRARILVAHLREMEDEVDYQDQNVEQLRHTISQLREESAKLWDQLEGKRLDNDPKAASLNESRGRMNQTANKLENELLTESRELEKMKSRLPRVGELIQWAEEHFKELRD